MTSECGALNYATINLSANMATATNQSQSNCNFWIAQTINDPGDNATCATTVGSIIAPYLASLPGGLGGLLGGLLG